MVVPLFWLPSAATAGCRGVVIVAVVRARINRPQVCPIAALHGDGFSGSHNSATQGVFGTSHYVGGGVHGCI